MLQMTTQVTPRTVMPSNGPSSSPDLTVTNSHLGLNASWHPITTLNSDHLPIIIDLDGWFAEPPSLKITDDQRSNIKQLPFFNCGSLIYFLIPIFFGRRCHFKNYPEILSKGKLVDNL